MPVVEYFEGLGKVETVEAVGGVEEVYGLVRGKMGGRGFFVVEGDEEGDEEGEGRE